jgi:hypothetical protein
MACAPLHRRTVAGNECGGFHRAAAAHRGALAPELIHIQEKPVRNEVTRAGWLAASSIALSACS